jgi:hypothetical protein
MICQGCGVEAPTKYVAFYQNIGALVMRFTKSVEGNLCKRCIHRYFWEFTPLTLLVGWLGTVSIIIAPCIVLNNVVRYLFCLGMEAPAPDAAPPQLTQEAVERLRPHLQRLADELNAGRKLDEVAREVADIAGVTPAQVVLFVRAVAKQAQGPAGGH